MQSWRVFMVDEKFVFLYSLDDAKKSYASLNTVSL